MPDTEFAQRRKRLVSQFREQKIDSFLVSALPNIRYLSGFTGSNAALLLTADRALLFTDPRYQAQAPQESDCDVKISKAAVLKDVLGWQRKLGVKRLGFERVRMSFSDYEFLREQSGGPKLVAVPDIVESLRMVKSSSEIASIRTAVGLNSAALDQALASFRPEMTETELTAEIEFRMRKLGADGPSFETIVASGPRTALPHAHPKPTPISANQLLLIDMGATVAGYASDMTRTMGIGHLPPKARRMYRAVLESQLAAIDKVRAGVASSAVDRAARGVLKQHGLDRLFVHSTGHGLGLEIHERPRIGRKKTERLEAGMAITIEPGAYLEGFGGVRIEDTVVVTEKGCEILTPTKKDLLIL